MTKKKTTSVGRKPAAKKTGKPKEGDRVYFKGETKFLEWIFRKKITIHGEELAFCTTLIPNMKNREEDKCLLEFVALNLLTLEPPPTPSQIFTIQSF